MPANTRIQVRRGTASSWTSTNPTLYAGEIGYETDSGRFKIGDGTTSWTSLDYNAVVPTGFLAGTGLSVNVAADGSTVTYSLSDPTIQVADITDFVDGVNDRVYDLITAGSNIQLTYTDNGNDTSTLSIAATGLSPSGHTHTLSNITDVTASATEVNYIDGSIPGSGVASKAVVLDSNNSIVNIGNITTTGNITVGNNLIVNGSTVTVNSTTVTIDDPIFTLGGDTNPSSDDNKDRGIEFRYHNGTSAKLGFFGYDDNTGKFTFIPDATNSSEIFSGTTGEIDAKIDWANINNKPDPVISGILTGDVTGTGTVTLNDLGNGTLSISATVVGLPSVSQTNTTVGPSGSFVSSVSVDTYGRVTGVNTTSHTVATTGVKGIASFDNADFSVTDGAVSIKTSGISNTQLEYNNITIGQTVMSLGGSYNAISGISAANPVTLTYFVIDGGTP